METYFKANKTWWNKLTSINKNSRSYDLESFKKTGMSLKPLERQWAGDVQGKKLLHLQCHFGMDSLSWATLGAQVTGVDFSPDAIALARWLAAEMNLSARFIECNIYDLPHHLADKFDIIITSYGVLCWLPELESWANVITTLLKPKGRFLLFESHPVTLMFKQDCREGGFLAELPYFHSPEPEKSDECIAYADHSQKLHVPCYEWRHSISDIITSLIRAGMKIDRFEEFPYSFYNEFPDLIRDKDGWFRFKSGSKNIPLMLGVTASLLNSD